MAGYAPLKITGNKTGLVQEREEFILPDDAYPILENAYVWRERIKRKRGYQLLGRLARVFEDVSVGVSGASVWSFNIYSSLTPAIVPEATAQIKPGSVEININPATSSGAITGYNNSTNCEVVSVAHGLSTGAEITISGVVVKPNTGPNLINGGPYIISVVGVNSFTINRSSVNWGQYASGGTWNRVVGSNQLFDQGDGTLATVPPSAVVGTINYLTGAVTVTNAAAGAATLVDFIYYPGLPVMGLRLMETSSENFNLTIAFDTVYAYRWNGTTWQEFLSNAAKTWTGTDYEFFWTTNYWIGTGNLKIFWATNNSLSGDPIRYTNGVDGTDWVDFAPAINNGGDFLQQALIMLPFRGRLVVFNTKEGPTMLNSQYYTNRIRWAAIGNPFDTVSPIVATVATDPWKDDIRGKGGFLDIPTNEDIVSVGFVRDNLVIYCENSTWQLRYTGRSIAPFQIEKVNSELGAEGTFSSVQFDTSLVGIGDKGVVECDSYKSNLIDIKIPDLVFDFQNANQGPRRVHGIRDFINRLAYWTFPSAPSNGKFPDQRLVYNYENDSWALFTDSLTCLGTFQSPSSRTWLNTPIPWIRCNFPWIQQTLETPSIIGGNQQGFVEYLDELTTNDESLFITNITGNGIATIPISGAPTVVNSPSHNMQTGTVIEIYEVSGSFSNLNFSSAPPYDVYNNVFSIIKLDDDNFQLMKYNVDDGKFDIAQIDLPGTYLGGGVIAIRDNFYIQSKKFNFLDQGQSIQMGYIDILMNSTGVNPEDSEGAISMEVFLDYNDSQSSNVDENEINQVTLGVPNTNFNSVIPTTQSNLNTKGGSKFWQRVYCPTRANFLTIVYTFNNAQMAGVEQSTDVQIDAQVLWIRKGGRMTQI